MGHLCTHWLDAHRVHDTSSDAHVSRHLTPSLRGWMRSIQAQCPTSSTWSCNLNALRANVLPTTGYQIDTLRNQDECYKNNISGAHGREQRLVLHSLHCLMRPSANSDMEISKLVARRLSARSCARTCSTRRCTQMHVTVSHKFTSSNIHNARTCFIFAFYILRRIRMEGDQPVAAQQNQNTGLAHVNALNFVMTPIL